MLKHIHIENFALIDSLDLNLKNGLTMITGETGAGKSILLGALGLVQGKRADLSAVRDTTRKCVVEAHVEMSSLALDELLESYDLDVEPVCFLRREILPSGKSRAFINDTPVTLATMSEVGNRLIDIHSQHQTLQLASDDFQIDVLQSFVNKLTEKAKEPASFLLDSFRIEWSQYKALKTQLNKWVEEEQLLSKEADYNNFLLEELDNAQLDQLDITALEQENEQLSNVEEIQLVLQEFQSMMDQDDNGLLDQLRLLKNRFTQISKYDSDFENANQRLHTTFLELEDLSEEMSRKADSVEADPARLEIINQRLVLIEQLLKKHHQEDVNGLIVLRDELADKVFTTQNISKKIKQARVQLDSAHKSLEKLGDKIHQQRVQQSTLLEEEVLVIIKQLGMPEASFKVNIEKKDSFNSYGMDEVEFRFTANKGTALLPLNKAASGGELSRLMLAIKALLSNYKNLPTIIFDEIDTGVSGAIAEKMAIIMQQMSTSLQVITITHLPQIASAGNDHLVVKKAVKDEQTISNIYRLNIEERVEEIAQMLSGGKISDAARENARVLLQ
ncbi:DNA repair protein RecN [Nonlabens ulvanivorans]|uniref:DNA repair protein RecN n=2 Tax=Nonlabens ulvanivorans TaxID=906888 RepID=A0A084JVL6_NONUL|nr:DNA repair protein RecN [Nonlabens ulvanivorans]KEZ93000.1 DNA repair protein RecN [Nonlabens ulvanivorans]PRX12770.1 DNA repair protein RecN (Recombination protein N) [Nonlabens ulvanivorans]